MSQFELSRKNLSHSKSSRLETNMHVPSFHIRTFLSMTVVTAISRSLNHHCCTSAIVPRPANTNPTFILRAISFFLTALWTGSGKRASGLLVYWIWTGSGIPNLESGSGNWDRNWILDSKFTERVNPSPRKNIAPNSLDQSKEKPLPQSPPPLSSDRNTNLSRC